MLSVRSKFKSYWNYLIIVIAIYNAFQTPLILAFPVAREYFTENLFLYYFDTLIDVLYYCDIVLGFFTTYFD